MKSKKRRRSVTQEYIVISDTLAAFRSALGFVYFLTAAALVFSCVIYLFFDFVPVNSSYNIAQGDTVTCLVQVRGSKPEKDDRVILSDSRLSAKVVEPEGFALENEYKDYGLSEEYILVSINEVNGSRTLTAVKAEDIEGKICLVVTPIRYFGYSIDKLFG